MSPSLHNITITAPNGTSNHGDPHLLCTPSAWTDIAIFFLANFVSHAATVKSIPGEPMIATWLTLLGALVLPLSGVLRGLNAIYSCAVFGTTPLETAAKAGALCMVVRNDNWKPKSGDRIQNPKIIFPPRDIANGMVPDIANGMAPLIKLMERIHIFKALSFTTRMLHAVTSGYWHNSETERHGHDSSFFHHSAHTPSIEDRNQQLSNISTLKLGIHRHNLAKFLPSATGLSPLGRHVYGTCSLPAGYALSLIPYGARILDLEGREAYDNSLSWHESLQRRFRPQEKHRGNYNISSSYGISKGLIAIFQTIYASITIYRTRGDQLQRYGYAAFGLTVAPYLVMSIVNLVSNIFRPDYDTIYLLDSEILEEASHREGARFEGMVGSIAVDDPEPGDEEFSDATFQIGDDGRIFVEINSRNPLLLDGREAIREASQTKEVFIDNKSSRSAAENSSLPNIILPSCSNRLGIDRLIWKLNSLRYAALIVGSLPFIVIGLLSHYDQGQSTLSQRVWTMLWLVFGVRQGICLAFNSNIGLREFRDLSPASRARGATVFDHDGEDETMSNINLSFPELTIFVLWGVAAVGGFVVVGQMLENYGNCVRLY